MAYRQVRLWTLVGLFLLRCATARLSPSSLGIFSTFSCCFRPDCLQTSVGKAQFMQPLCNGACVAERTIFQRNIASMPLSQRAIFFNRWHLVSSSYVHHPLQEHLTHMAPNCSQSRGIHQLHWIHGLLHHCTCSRHMWLSDVVC